MNGPSRAVLRPMPDSGLRSVDDLLTDEERDALRADLAEIHRVMHPCWEDR